MTLGQAGTTTLTEELEALPKEHYRIERHLVAEPADLDGDCIDDITELQDRVGRNPLNPAPVISFANGALAIPDRETFEGLSYKGAAVSIDTHLVGLEFVKFVLFGMDTNHPGIYFQNTETHRAHFQFESATDLWSDPRWHRFQGTLRGVIVFHPNIVAPDGSLGVYRFEFEPVSAVHFADVSHSYELLAASMPLIENNLSYYPLPGRALQLYKEEEALYKDSRVTVLAEDDILPDVDFVLLNRGQGYGALRLMTLEERPNPRDIVIYETLPNELSRVAGIITTVPQTPLSHVNLRAVQDGAPNAFIRDALHDHDIGDLIGSYVHYTVDESGYTIRAATPEEVDAHYAGSRPSEPQTPERDLTVTQITALNDVAFDDWDAFGVKAANMAVLRTLGFPEGTVPDGFAVPFYFYDEFMKHNGFYDDIEEMLVDPNFQSDYDTQASELKKLRKKIKNGETPVWIVEALEEMHATYPEGQSLRYRSSTNNEDLPGFSGAGLYDSKTQKPDETAEEGIDKSLKQVYASLWNFRAFTEREFHRIDHMITAMGVLVHPNFSDERANGVAVSFDPIRGTDGAYYVNTQLGEDLVTNPEARSIPEEILLHGSGTYEVLATSNQVARGQLLMSDAQMVQLRSHLEVIHDELAELYGIEADDLFAIEIEFKITSEDVLSIKQARPWVFTEDSRFDNGPASGEPIISGTPRVGETLTVDTSEIADPDGLADTIFEYQWIQNDGTGDTDIQDAVGSTYPLEPGDEGRTIRVRVNFTDDRGNKESLSSASTAAVKGEIPVWSADMSVVDLGNGAIGAVRADLFSNIGGSSVLQAKWLWYYTPERQLRLAFSEGVPGTADLTLQVGDLVVELDPGDSNFTWEDVDVDWEDGQTISARIARFATIAAEAPNAPATGKPTISGTVETGETLTADVSGIADADGLDNATFIYQWIANHGNTDVDISGATDSTYVLSDDDAGKTIKVRVSFRDGADNEESLTSASTTAVAATVPGAPQHLKASPHDAGALDLSWHAPVSDGGSDITHYRVQWKDASGSWDTLPDVSEETATGPAHTLSGLTGGVEYAVRVIAVNDVGEGSPSAEVSAAPESGPAAAWTATLTVETRRSASGYTLFGQPTLGALSETRFEVDGATHTVYYVLLMDSELNFGMSKMFDYAFVLRVGDEEFASGEASAERVNESPYRFRWADPGLGWTHGDEVEVSLVLGESVQNTPATGKPTISGTVETGETLTADVSGIADANGMDGALLKYQWIRSNGGTERRIYRATASSYTLRDADRGSRIGVEVSFLDNNNFDEKLTSDMTAAVTPPDPLTGFTVVNAANQQVLGALTGGAALRLSDPDNGAFGIRVETDYRVRVGSVRLELSGAKTVSQTENYAPYSLYGDSEGGLNGQPLPVGSYFLRATAYSGRALGGNVLGTLEVSFTVAAAEHLTARLENPPQSHDGQTAFTFELRFSEHIAGLSYLTLRDDALTVTGGQVTEVRRMDRHSATRNIHWQITVTPDGTGDVTIVLPAATDCGVRGAVCTGSGGKLSDRLEFTISGPGE